jgi:hypothetical protein
MGLLQIARAIAPKAEIAIATLTYKANLIIDFQPEVMNVDYQPQNMWQHIYAFLFVPLAVFGPLLWPVIISIIAWNKTNLRRVLLVIPISTMIFYATWKTPFYKTLLEAIHQTAEPFKSILLLTFAAILPLIILGFILLFQMVRTYFANRAIKTNEGKEH